MKPKSCPSCDSEDIGDRWCAHRMLQYFCRDCEWAAPIRTPSKRKITNIKSLLVDDFFGFDYVIYDKYGHTSTVSRTYSTENAAQKEMEEDLIRGEKNDDAGPYTGVLFKTPAQVNIVGKMFKIKSGTCKRVK